MCNMIRTVVFLLFANCCVNVSRSEDNLLDAFDSLMQMLPIHCTCNLTDNKILLAKIEETRIRLSNEDSGRSDRCDAQSDRCDARSDRCDARSNVNDGNRPVDWKKLPGSAVEISAKGKELWVINSAQNIFRWNGSNWEQKPGAAVRVGASPDGWTWIVNKDDYIYRWNVDTNTWDLMPGRLAQISAETKNRAMGAARNMQIFLWTGSSWKRISGGAVWTGIGDGDERWVVSIAQKIWRWNHQINNWHHMPGKAINIDVQNPCRVIITNEMDQMFIWKNNNWHLINGTGTRSSISDSHYYTVNRANEIFVGN